LKATDILRKDHEHVRRLEKIVSKASQSVYDEVDIPILHLEKITLIISEFLDAIHYSREENSYFPCASVNGNFAEEVRKFMIEHQFGKNVAYQISRHLNRWKAGEDAREKRSCSSTLKNIDNVPPRTKNERNVNFQKLFVRFKKFKLKL